MKLTVLVDNNTLIDQYYLAEPGVCYYIEDGDCRLLFDVGYSDVFIQNAKLMNIDLAAVSTVAISHGHNDHTRGLKYLSERTDLNRVKLVAHPLAFKPKIFSGQPIGCPVSEQALRHSFYMALTERPLKISDNITFLGQIPRLNDFEARQVFGSVIDDERCYDDVVLDDSALVYQCERGLFIITGCSHSGVCNIIEYAKQVCGDDRVIGVIGGFHLFELSAQLTETIHYFQSNQINYLLPCHCVSFAAKAAIHQAIPIEEVGVGLTIEV
jgi:7,8-dihydropterin-6-yl-methyl-4-(beta-D-ribofuranosyl)aminobenzene 5'-phosphate synthase